MRIILIRHGMTEANAEGRYIGRTDEPLSARSESLLSRKKYPNATALICSPMKRCVQSAALIYPLLTPRIYDGLRECDFGDFEGKNYAELNGNAAYQAWIDSGGTLPFPNGESLEDFRRRSVEAFKNAAADFKDSQGLAFVVHGGTIMSVMSALAGGNYFDYQVKNGGGYETVFNGKKINVLNEI